MNQISSPLPTAPAAADVLTKAVLRAAEKLEINQRDLASVLGISGASVSRLSRERMIDPESKEGELALMFVRVFRSLDAVVGGDEDAGRRWLWADNQHLGGVPGELIKTVAGLSDVAGYLDAIRGKL